jgi:UDP:flavonoid glycosyltransferase YjiC (YdhE family)
MRIVILAVGTLGDVAPYTGLGTRLRDTGQDVTIATHPRFAPLIQQSGLGFAALPMDVHAELGNTPAQRLLGNSPLALGRATRMLSAHWREMGDAMIAAAEDADLLLLSTLGWLGCHVAEGMGIPSIGAFLQPMDPTAEFPAPVLTTRSLGRWGNRASARLLRTGGQWPLIGAVNDLRARFGLARTTPGAVVRQLDRQRWPILYGFSPSVVAQPLDWPAYRKVVGYWWPQRPSNWHPSAQLMNFLAAGPPPVFVGFGSMSSEDGSRTGALIASALRAVHARGVIQCGQAHMCATGDDLLEVEDIPHEWLFPHMGAVVHHAGAGTTAAGLRAGVPTVAVPLASDQPFWASRLERLGVGPRPIAFGRLSVDALAAAVRAALEHPGYRDQARRVAEAIATEDGAGQAVDAIMDNHGTGL